MSEGELDLKSLLGKRKIGYENELSPLKKRPANTATELSNKVSKLRKDIVRSCISSKMSLVISEESKHLPCAFCLNCFNPKIDERVYDHDFSSAKSSKLVRIDFSVSKVGKWAMISSIKPAISRLRHESTMMILMTLMTREMMMCQVHSVDKCHAKKTGERRNGKFTSPEAEPMNVFGDVMKNTRRIKSQEIVSEVEEVLILWKKENVLIKPHLWLLEIICGIRNSPVTGQLVTWGLQKNAFPFFANFIEEMAQNIDKREKTIVHSISSLSYAPECMQKLGELAENILQGKQDNLKSGILKHKVNQFLLGISDEVIIEKQEDLKRRRDKQHSIDVFTPFFNSDYQNFCCPCSPKVTRCGLSHHTCKYVEEARQTALKTRTSESRIVLMRLPEILCREEEIQRKQGHVFVTQSDRYNRRLEWATKMLGSVCNVAKCNANSFLELNHIDPHNKLCDPSVAARQSWIDFISEVMKCELLCCSCHKKVTRLQKIA